MVRTSYQLLIILFGMLVLSGCEFSNMKANDKTDQASLNANSVCSIVSTITGATITCGSTSANINHGQDGAAGNSSSPYYVVIDGNGNQIGTSLMSTISNTQLSIWDDADGGFSYYDAKDGRRIAAMAGQAPLIYLASDCSGTGYVISAGAQGGATGIQNQIFSVNNKDFKVKSDSVTFAPGTTYYLYQNATPACQGAGTVVAGEIYSSVEELSAAHLPFQLTMPFRIERR